MPCFPSCAFHVDTHLPAQYALTDTGLFLQEANKEPLALHRQNVSKGEPAHRSSTYPPLQVLRTFHKPGTTLGKGILEPCGCFRESTSVRVFYLRAKGAAYLFVLGAQLGQGAPVACPLALLAA